MKIQLNRKPMIHFSSIGLTDIVFLLLIFFMLTSSFVVQPGIKIKLPKAASGQTDETDKIFITITRNESIYLNQKRVSQADLGNELIKAFNERPDRMVVIRADKDLSLETTIKVIDKAKLAGAEKFLIATEQGL